MHFFIHMHSVPWVTHYNEFFVLVAFMMCCKNMCLCFKNVFVFKCVCVYMYIAFFWPHIAKNMHRGYIDTERAAMWPALSKMPNRKHANYQVIQLQEHKNLEINFRHKLYVSVWRRMKWWCAYFSTRHLGEYWSHNSSFCVNVSPTHIFGNVWPKNGCTFPF